MTRKKPEFWREIKNPVGYPSGTVLEEFMDGSKTIHMPDGTHEFIDAQGKALSKINITDAQIEAWKKMPEEEALKEGIKLFQMENMDVPEARLRLEVLKFLCEIRGVMQPAKGQAQAVIVQINMGNDEKKIIPVNVGAVECK